MDTVCVAWVGTVMAGTDEVAVVTSSYQPRQVLNHRHASVSSTVSRTATSHGVVMLHPVVQHTILHEGVASPGYTVEIRWLCNHRICHVEVCSATSHGMSL